MHDSGFIAGGTDDRYDRDARFIIFGMKQMIKHLAACKRWQQDGTFATRAVTNEQHKNKWKQVLTVKLCNTEDQNAWHVIIIINKF